MKTLKIAIFIISLIHTLNIHSQNITINPIGIWNKENINTPYFSYLGDLPYSVNLKDGNPAVIHNDPYFLLGNYKFKLFTHISNPRSCNSSVANNCGWPANMTLSKVVPERGGARINTALGFLGSSRGRCDCLTRGTSVLK